MHTYFKLAAACLCAALFAPSLMAQPATGAIETTTFATHPAYRLHTDKLEAIIVPEMGRVMSFGRIGGPNLLWNNPSPGNPYPNWGGDKDFIGPHYLWGIFGPTEWPPRHEWDGVPLKAEVQPNGHLHMSGPPWPSFDAEISRDFYFDADGNFVMDSTLKRLGASPMPIFLWPVTQVKAPDEIYVPLNPASPYKDASFFISAPVAGACKALSPRVGSLKCAEGSMFKVGFDSPVESLAARWGRDLFVLSSPKKDEQYPDGALGAGFTVEIYNADAGGAGHYVELELLSPVKWMAANDTIQHTVRWNVVTLSTDSPSADDVQKVLGAGK